MVKNCVYIFSSLLLFSSTSFAFDRADFTAVVDLVVSVAATDEDLAEPGLLGEVINYCNIGGNNMGCEEPEMPYTVREADGNLTGCICAKPGAKKFSKGVKKNSNGGADFTAGGTTTETLSTTTYTTTETNVKWP